MNHLVILSVLALALSSASAAYVPRRGLDLGFPVYTNKPLGRRTLPGGHAPAALSLFPEDTRRSIAVPTGFEARFFASEPEVVNSVAMTWDDRGRLWVLELYEYPKGAAKGQKGRGIASRFSKIPTTTGRPTR